MAKAKPVSSWNVEHDGSKARLNLYVNKDGARIECPSLGFNFEGPNIAELRERAEEKTRERMAAVWTAYIEIEMSGGRAADWNGRRLELRYRFIHVSPRKPDLPEPETVPSGAPERSMNYVWKHVTERGGEPGYADMLGVRNGLPPCIIRDTPEARSGLAAITVAMTALEEKLKGMLQPDRAAVFLSGLASGRPLLGA